MRTKLGYLYHLIQNLQIYQKVDKIFEKTTQDGQKAY